MTVFECPADGCEFRSASLEGVSMHYVNKVGSPHDQITQKWEVKQKATEVAESKARSESEPDSDGPDGPTETEETETQQTDETPEETDELDPPVVDPETDPSGPVEEEESDEWHTIPAGYWVELDPDEHPDHETGWSQSEGSEEYNPARGVVREDGEEFHALRVLDSDKNEVRPT